VLQMYGRIALFQSTRRAAEVLTGNFLWVLSPVHEEATTILPWSVLARGLNWRHPTSINRACKSSHARL
jgi:hypothetical protein